MTNNLSTLLDLPAAAHLAVADGELALLTITHEHADKMIVERRRLGTSIDLAELLGIIGAHGLAEMPQLRVSEVAAPQLPAPEPETPAAETTPTVACPKCQRTFKTQHAVDIHVARGHREQPKVPVKEPLSSHVVCPHCPVRVSRSNLARHIRTYHSAEPTPEPEAATIEPGPEPTAQTHATLDAQNEYLCSTCGTSLRLHDRCGDCAALLGEGHEAGTGVDAGGRVVCAMCVGYHRVERELGLVAA